MVIVQEKPINTGHIYSRFHSVNKDLETILSFTSQAPWTLSTSKLKNLRLFAKSDLIQIEKNANQKWSRLRTLIISRYGNFKPAETILFVALASHSKSEALQAFKFFNKNLKIDSSFWKNNDGGSVKNWIEPSKSDYENTDNWV